MSSSYAFIIRKAKYLLNNNNKQRKLESPPKSKDHCNESPRRSSDIDISIANARKGNNRVVHCIKIIIQTIFLAWIIFQSKIRKFIDSQNICKYKYGKRQKREHCSLWMIYEVALHCEK